MITTTLTISAADVFTPRAAANELRKVASVYADHLLASIEQSRSNLTREGVTGAPIEMLGKMFDAAQIVVAAAEKAADKCDQHVQVVADTVGSDDSLAGTQAGRYMDPAAL